MTTATASPAPATAHAQLLCEAMNVGLGNIREVSREPSGQGSVSGFEVDAEGTTLLAYVDTSGTSVAQETGFVLDGVGRVWLHPADPHLPALAPVAFGSSAHTLLARVGITAAAEPEFLAYRPGRRAVLRVRSTSGEIVWIKIVRPRHVEQIVDAHRACQDAGLPVPGVRAWSPDGLLVLDSARGMPATDAPWTPQNLVAAASDMCDRIAQVPATRRVRSAALDRVEWYSARMLALAPELELRTRAVQRQLERTPDSHEITAHGDLHFGQLFLDEAGAELTGLIDLDTLGRADAAEDPAAFISHAVASTELALDATVESRLRELVDAATQRWGASPAVRGRVAAQLLGHATAAWDRRDVEHGLRLFVAAESWAGIKSPK